MTNRRLLLTAAPLALGLVLGTAGCRKPENLEPVELGPITPDGTDGDEAPIVAVADDAILPQVGDTTTAPIVEAGENESGEESPTNDSDETSEAGGVE